MKEFTVGDMIRILEKLDPDLPIYDHFYDTDSESECWFNIERPKPRRKLIYLRSRKRKRKIVLEWTDEKTASKSYLEKKHVVLFYPPEKGVVEIG